MLQVSPSDASHRQNRQLHESLAPFVNYVCKFNSVDDGDAEAWRRPGGALHAPPALDSETVRGALHLVTPDSLAVLQLPKVPSLDPTREGFLEDYVTAVAALLPSGNVARGLRGVLGTLILYDDYHLPRYNSGKIEDDIDYYSEDDEFGR
ncbi:hypothetical protein JAAARDRAFT_188615 [Jaapia argillacea MUCL 33604]|uniref:Uncharacterized protein n=1 Tax=Jaapia argillacea MUCL 33604 TaxID=933084 RepID=A0A067QHL2_9AGAM|nr:hypothetical protein JAAARDRAFT_188615 [Jaapia argillacea MUCL 33604]